jgi:hypothetical protein
MIPHHIGTRLAKPLPRPTNGYNPLFIASSRLSRVAIFCSVAVWSLHRLSTSTRRKEDHTGRQMAGRHFVLDEPIPETTASKLLGRVVLEITCPLRAFAPREATCNPLNIIPNLLPTPLLSSNRKDFLQTQISRSARSGLTDLFGFNLARMATEKMTLESQLVRRYSLEQTRDVFDSLMKDESYSGEVRRFLKEHGTKKGYLVTGFVTTEGSVWTRERNRGREAGLQGELPVTAAVTAPMPGVDLGVKLSTSDNNLTEQKFESKEPLIFAVAYDVVILKKRFDKATPGYFKDEVVLGPAKHANPKYLTLRPDGGIIYDEEAMDEDGMLEDVKLVGSLDLEDVDSEWDGLSFEIE